MSCGVPAMPGYSSLVLALQAIHHLEQQVGAGLHRFVLGAFQIDPGIAVLDPEMGGLGRRGWWRAMATETTKASVVTEAHVVSRTMPPIIGAISRPRIRLAHHPLVIGEADGFGGGGGGGGEAGSTAAGGVAAGGGVGGC